MRLLQLNIWGGRLEKQLSHLIEQESPDIICLQEVIKLPGSTGGLFLTLQAIQQQHGYQYVLFSPMFSFQFMRGVAAFGNCILSKYPFIETKTIYTNSTHVEDFDFNFKDYNVRNLQYTKIDTPKGELHVLNHHGYHVPEHKRGNQETKRQCKIIADFVQTLPGKIILTGDFNLTPRSKSIALLNNVLNNLCIEHDVDTTRTNLTNKQEVCDYIFNSPDLKVMQFKVIDYVASDHKALSVTL